MTRDFCLSCGLLGRSADCACGVSAARLQELEQRERADLEEFAAACPISMHELAAFVQADGGLCVAHEFIRAVHHHDPVFKESIFKTTPDGLVQLIYEKGTGSRLLKWPWVMKQDGAAPSHESESL